MKKHICVHGHFYQPPRENPWLNKVEIQDSAYPFHDWNHRINAECYRRNTASRILNSEGAIDEIMNNFAWMSFNVGPTLLAWMENEAPETYKGILEADKESQERFSGHGSALAQAYNHLIMPLANEKDKETQVIWGIEDFRVRFGRFPEGMWLAETAVNTDSLEAMAKQGIKFTILSPYQAKRTRKQGKKEWQDASNAKVDTKKAYVCNLPSGNKINLFFYDGPASQGVAFEGLLDNGERFAKRLQGQFSEDENVQLVNIATDGESYGHHHTLGEMALSYCLNEIEEKDLANLTIYGEFLEKFPPQDEVEILENTAWSCPHGVERWKSDCGCNTGGHDDWNQKWRAPLRESFDWVREKLIGLYESEMQNFTDNPWESRNKYIQVVLNREPENVTAFLNENFTENLSEADEVKILKLLEMQYHCMLMYTSCGWFFDEVTGIESMQDIFYATRAVQLAEEISGNSYKPEFESLLEKIPSNIPEYGNALTAYNKFVKPMELDMIRIGAHYAVSSVFEEFPEEINLYNFNALIKKRNFYEAGKQKLVIGHTEFQSGITREKVDIAYAVLHIGGHHLAGGVRKYIGEEALEEMHAKAAEYFKKGNIYEIFYMIDSYFGNHNYSFWHLFRDEQRDIMELIMENNLSTVEAAMQQVYDSTYPLVQALQGLDMQIPDRLKKPVEIALNNKLIHLLKDPDFEFGNFRKLIHSADLIFANLDTVTLNFLLDEQLIKKTQKLSENPADLELLKESNNLLEFLKESSLNPGKWEAQNIIFDLKEAKFQEFAENAEKGDETAQTWIEEFQKLVRHLNLS